VEEISKYDLDLLEYGKLDGTGDTEPAGEYAFSMESGMRVI
jgi:hypothetical protein